MTLGLQLTSEQIGVLQEMEELTHWPLGDLNEIL